MKIRNIMTRHPSVVVRESTIAAATRIMRDRHVAMLPVINDLCERMLAGVITDHDVVVRCVANGFDGRSHVGDHMTSDKLAYVLADGDVGDAAAIMSERGLRRLPVCDADGRLVGVVALADLASRLTPRNPRVVHRVEYRISGAHLAAMR